jgi:hypothetical protein
MNNTLTGESQNRFYDQVIVIKHLILSHEQALNVKYNLTIMGDHIKHAYNGPGFSNSFILLIMSLFCLLIGMGYVMVFSADRLRLQKRVFSFLTGMLLIIFSAFLMIWAVSPSSNLTKTCEQAKIYLNKNKNDVLEQPKYYVYMSPQYHRLNGIVNLYCGD